VWVRRKASTVFTVACIVGEVWFGSQKEGAP
jgi:hypothetical protein